METPQVNDRDPKNTPRFSHLFLLLGWVLYFLSYYLTENYIPEEACHLIHVALDDRIPFREEFVIFYVGWYFLIALSLGYFLIYDIPYFRALQTYIIVVQVLSVAVYILYPSYQDLRPAVFPRENALTDLVRLLYRLDTPTGVCPSLHVGISLGIASTWLRVKGAKAWVKAGIVLFCLGVCASVVFIKQHSAADIAAAIPVCLFAEWFVFFRRLHS